MQVANLLGEEIPQIYALCGRTSRASLRVLRPGLAVTEMAVSPLPGVPAGVWTVSEPLGRTGNLLRGWQQLHEAFCCDL